MVEAVKNGQFHIYTVTKVDEAIELLTGVKAGLIEGRTLANNLQEEGNAPENQENGSQETIYNIIRNYLDDLSENNEIKIRKSGFFARIFGKN